MLYDTLSTVGLDSSVSQAGDAGHVLDVEMLQSSTILAHILHSSVSHQSTALHTQLLQVGAVLREQLQTQVTHVTLANVQ